MRLLAVAIILTLWAGWLLAIIIDEPSAMERCLQTRSPDTCHHTLNR